MKNQFFIENTGLHQINHLKIDEKETRTWIFNEDTSTHQKNTEIKLWIFILNKRSSEKGTEWKAQIKLQESKPCVSWWSGKGALEALRRKWELSLLLPLPAGTATSSLGHKDLLFSAPGSHTSHGHHRFAACRPDPTQNLLQAPTYILFGVSQRWKINKEKRSGMKVGIMRAYLW